MINYNEQTSACPLLFAWSKYRAFFVVQAIKRYIFSTSWSKVVYWMVSKALQWRTNCFSSYVDLVERLWHNHCCTRMGSSLFSCFPCYLRGWGRGEQLSGVEYILVMQCFRVGYRGICHASLVFSVYTRAFRRMCIRRKYKWQVACSTVSHEKALHNYFIPCLNLRKIHGNFRKLRKRFKPVIEELL